jgi:tetratricopeptide (TPR) repeat protein
MPEIIKAFVARSFAEPDVQRLDPLLTFLKTFETFGLFCHSAEPAEAEQVSAKVQRLIQECSVFIGMFTRKYPIIDGISSQPGPTSEHTRWTAPAWVLQESGYALGLGNKKLLFFVEDGVELPELAGDLEYIAYNFAKADAAFKRVNEALGKIIRENLALEVSPAIRQATQTTPPEPAAEQQEDKPEERGLFTCLEGIWAALKARNKEAAQRAFEEGLEHVRKENKGSELFWRVLYQQECVDNGYPEGLTELYALEAEFPDEAGPTSGIAHCLRQFKDFVAAAEAFQRAASKKSSGDNFSYYTTSAAECLQQAGDVVGARTVLLEGLNGASPKSRMEIMSKIYDNLKASSRKYEAFAVAEHSLQRNGAQTDLHFKVAYDYSEHDLNDLASYHYQSVLDQREDFTAMNNLAVALWALELPVEAVDHYKKAFKGGNTLAAGNLAYRYLNAGMVEEARSVVDHALKADEPNPMVTDAFAEISRRRNDEATKHEVVLAEASRKREFLAQMGEAVLTEQTVDVTGRWKFPDVVIELSVEGKIIKGTTSRPIGGMALTGLLGGLDQGEQAKTDVYTFRGVLAGRVGEFTLSVEQKDAAGYPNYYFDRQSRRGYVVFASDGKTARVLEIEPKMTRYDLAIV